MPAESRHACRIAACLQNQGRPTVREHHPDQDVTSIKLVTQPTTESLEGHDNLLSTRWGERAVVLDLFLREPATKKPQRISDKKRPPLGIFIHGDDWGRGLHHRFRPAAISLAKRVLATAAMEY